MRRVFTALLALAALLAGAAPAAAISEATLQSTIAREMAKAPAASGAYLRDMDTGVELYALRENAVRIPASVEKLFTTSAALLRLGPSATLTTRAVTAPDAIVEPGGTLRGDLVLVGGGDPFFGDDGRREAREVDPRRRHPPDRRRGRRRRERLRRRSARAAARATTPTSAAS